MANSYILYFTIDISNSEVAAHNIILNIGKSVVQFE